MSVTRSEQHDAKAHQVGTEVVAALGRGWSVDAASVGQNNGCVQVTGPHGTSLSFESAWVNIDRITITGCYPEHYGYGVPTCSISVSAKRGGRAIARDISHRLMPVYLAELEKLKIFLGKLAIAEQNRIRLAEQIRNMFPESTIMDEDPRTSQVNRVSLTMDHAPIGRVSLAPAADTVTLLLRGISPDMMFRILAMVKNPEIS